MSRLLNKFRQERTISCILHILYILHSYILVAYKKQLKNFFFNNLDLKRVTDNKQFWKTVKPCLTEKSLKYERITLIEHEKVVSDERELVKIFNEYFSNTASNLDIRRPPNITFHYDPVLNAIKKIENRPSILEIKKMM